LRMAQQNVHEAVLRANDLKEVVRLDHMHLNVISTCVAVHDAMHCASGFGRAILWALSSIALDVYCYVQPTQMSAL
jgi:hypothetical protein